MNKILLSIFFLIAFTSLIVGCKNDTADQAEINEKKIFIEVASNADQQYQGLSDRTEICEDCGMLFTFSKKTVRTFVMRKMKFPLDIIWINNGKIIKIDKSLTPEGEFPANRYASIAPVDNVLEVNGGFADKYGFKIGDTVKYNYETDR